MTNRPEPWPSRLAGRQIWRLAGAGLSSGPPHSLPGSARLAALGEWVASRRGAQRFLVALIAGAASALAMAPYHLVPLLVCGFTILAWQLDGLGRYERRIGTAALIGWAFGVGYFTTGLYWVGNAFLVDAAAFGALMPLGVGALSLGLALFSAAALALARLLWRPGASRVLVLAIAWSGFEWLRGHVLTGFPWNLAGHTWGATLAMLQISSLFGIYGLSLITVFAAASPAALTDFGEGRGAGAPIGAALWPLAALLILGGFFGYGAARLHSGERPDVPGVRLRLVQASIPQIDKLTTDDAARIFERHMALMRRPGADKITVFVWPEAAVPILLSETPGALSAIAQALRPGQWLIAGSARYEPGAAGQAGRYYNSMHVISSDGAIIATYDKHHLVPFGEYLPLKGVLRLLGLRQLVESESGFSPGPGLHTLQIPGVPDLGPLICYEAIFPGQVTDPQRRPAWLLNITDDTWFGLGAGPRQHFENARIRAIEEGLPLVRDANNGISAVIDAKGRVRERLALNAVGDLDSGLPQAGPPTVYARLGDLAYLGALLLMGLAWLAARWVEG